MIAIGSLLNGITGSFYDSVIPHSGHIRIEDARMADSLNPLGLELLLPNTDSLVAKIKAIGDPRIEDVEPVLSFGALLVEDRDDVDPRNLAMRGMGVSPKTRFADNVRFTMKEGSFLPDGQGIALSERAARLVGAKLGSGLLVLVQDRNREPWYERLVVTGLFATESSDFDETIFYIAESKAAAMLDAAGMAREIRLLLANREDADSVAKEITTAISGNTPDSPQQPATLRIQTWQKINASIFALLLFVKILLGIIMALFAIVSGTIIANSSLMSVMERIREYGTMRAMGLRALSLERLILIEGLMLGALGAVLGIGIGFIIVTFLSIGGIDLGGIMESVGLSRYNRPRLNFWWFAFCTLTSLIVSLVATAKAARSVGALGVAESLTTSS
jgi:ABC-type lipoprotein release transport system permease subunit